MARKTDEGRSAGQRSRPSDCLCRQIDGLGIATKFRLVHTMPSDSRALVQLALADLKGLDTAPALAQAIIEKGFLEDCGQAEVYRWLIYFWPGLTRDEMCRAYRLASELFAADFLERIG